MFIKVKPLTISLRIISLRLNPPWRRIVRIREYFTWETTKEKERERERERERKERVEIPALLLYLKAFRDKKETETKRGEVGEIAPRLFRAPFYVRRSRQVRGFCVWFSQCFDRSEWMGTLKGNLMYFLNKSLTWNQKKQTQNNETSEQTAKFRRRSMRAIPSCSSFLSLSFRWIGFWKNSFVCVIYLSKPSSSLFLLHRPLSLSLAWFRLFASVICLRRPSVLTGRPLHDFMQRSGRSIFWREFQTWWRNPTIICNSSHSHPVYWRAGGGCSGGGGGVVAFLSPRENETFVMYIGRDFNDFGCPALGPRPPDRETD